jgi:hypothetical protein
MINKLEMTGEIFDLIDTACIHVENTWISGQSIRRKIIFECVNNIVAIYNRQLEAQSLTGREKELMA